VRVTSTSYAWVWWQITHQRITTEKGSKVGNAVIFNLQLLNDVFCTSDYKGPSGKWAVNNELEGTWKERVIARSEVHSDSVFVNRLRKTMTVFSHDNRFLVQDFNPRPPEENDGKLLTRPQRSGSICAKMVEAHPRRPNKSTAVACCKTEPIRSLISNPHIFVFFVHSCLLAVGDKPIVSSWRVGNYFVDFSAFMEPNVHH